MGSIFSDRMTDVPRSFIREILKVTSDRSVISFAGGLPNRDLFPIEDLQLAANRVFEKDPKDALQYSITEGYLPLREWIANRYREKQGLKISPEEILITTGSQQALDLLGKVFINDKDPLLIEEPGYLGAIQSFSLYRASFYPIPLKKDGICLESLEKTVKQVPFKLFYTVPNFQNPSGITYSSENRKQVAEILSHSHGLLVEDDPYGELRFMGERSLSFKHFLPEQTILLGSFSKIAAPSLRLGWIVASSPIMEKLITAKQASDLHTNYFSQRMLYEYLIMNKIDSHIEKIRAVYKSQRDAMVEAIRSCFPQEIDYTEPEGGMFLWVTLPKEFSAIEFFYQASERKVVFVPGNPFYTNNRGEGVSTLRLNFSCVDVPTIQKGIGILGEILSCRLMGE